MCLIIQFSTLQQNHFQIKPEIKASGGLILNLDKGVHDSDYYLEVSVTNIAKLTTVITKKDKQRFIKHYT
jgi:hypothetical protein